MKYRARGLYFDPYFDLAKNPDLLEPPPFIVPPLSVKQCAGSSSTYSATSTVL